jgi:predicted ATPase
MAGAGPWYERGGNVVMHPKITRLYVHNYRCFVNFELRPEGRSLLLGYNGAGKSSIFDVLAAIQDLSVRNTDAPEAFPRETLTAFAGQSDQRFELDVLSEWGTFRYVLHLEHEEKRKGVAIVAEAVTLDGKPLYQFIEGSVQLYQDDLSPARQAFSFPRGRSFLASLEPNAMNQRVMWFKEFIAGIWVLRFNPARMTGAATDDDTFLARDAANFGAWCRNLLAEAPDAVQRAREALKEVMPAFESVRAQAVGRGKVLVVKLNRPGGPGYEVDFDALSDGQKVLVALYIIVHGVAPRATVLCLDEPDNFVSIREIQPFLVDLTRISEDTGLQTLLISHSAEVIDFIGAEDAILLEGPDGAPPRRHALARQVAPVVGADGARVACRSVRPGSSSSSRTGRTGAAARQAIQAWPPEPGRVDPPSLSAARKELARVQ